MDDECHTHVQDHGKQDRQDHTNEHFLSAENDIKDHEEK